PHRHGLFRRQRSGDAPIPLALPGPSLDEQIKEATAARQAAAAMDPPPALLRLARQLRLSAFARDTLLLCAAVEFDPAFATLYARAQGNPARTYPTFALALSAFDDPPWEALAAHRPLRRAHLLEISQPNAVPLTSSPLRADERSVNFIK